MRKNNTFKFLSKKDYLNEVVDFLEEKLLNKTINNKVINVALSGGNTPMPILKKLSEKKISWKQINFFIIDERCVPVLDEYSNYKNLKNNFFKEIKVNVFPVYEERLGGEKSAHKYNELIKRKHFDLILLGMGDDGHVASLFPGTKALQEGESMVVYNEVNTQKNNRITFTYPALLAANEIVFLIRGEKKKNLLELIVKTKDDKYPVTKIINEGNNITWLVEE